MVGRALQLALGTLWATGCFSEPTAAPERCPPTTQGCACGDGDLCQGALSCQSGACVMSGCSLGAELCFCNDGQCVGNLVCGLLDICQPPGGSDSTGPAPTSGAAGTTANETTAPLTESSNTQSAGSTSVVGTGPMMLGGIYEPCTDTLDCIDALLCHVTNGHCTQACGAGNLCPPSPGEGFASCRMSMGEDLCVLDCSAVQTCPNDLICVVGQCIYDGP